MPKNKYLILALALMIAKISFAGDEMSVFFSNTSVKKVEKAIKDNVSGAGTITVYGRYRDFKDSLKKSPDYVVADEIFQTYSPDYEKVASMKVGESSKISLVLLAIDESWKKKDISKGKVGFVESGDRKEIQKYLEDKFGKPFDSVKTVSKPEDLFPLMVFKSVDFIAVEPHIYEDLKARFSAKVFEVAKSKEIIAPSLYVKKGTTAKFLDSFKAIKKDDLGALGFSGVE